MYDQKLTLFEKVDFFENEVIDIMKKIRGNNVKDRLKIMHKNDGMKVKSSSFSWSKLILGLHGTYSGYKSMIDFYLDIYITKIIYDAN